MNEELKDKGLKRAIKEQPRFRLPSNFTFRTMQKVDEAILLREKKLERRTLFATIAASLFLIASGIGGLCFYFGDNIKDFFLNAFRSGVPSTQIQIPSFYFLFIVAIPIFLLFDRWMRKQYFKHHSS